MSGPNEELMRCYGTAPLVKEAGTPFAAKMLFAMAAMQMARNFAEEQQYQRLQAKALNDRFQQLQSSDLGPTRDAMQHSRPRVFIGPTLPMGGPSDPNNLSGIPLGWDEGMVRTAAVADAVGADLAKTALGLTPIVQGAQRAGQAVRGALQSGATKRFLAAGQTLPPVAAGGSPFRMPSKTPVPSPAGPSSSGIGSTVKSLGRGLVTAGALGVGAAGLGALSMAKPAIGYLSREQETPTYGASAYGSPQLSYGVNRYGQPQLGAPFIQ
jgi:hypothetical protein